MIDAKMVLKNAREIIDLSPTAWAITTDDAGQMSARVVQTVALTDNWEAAFFTNFDTRKVREIEQMGSLLMGYHWGEVGSYVTLSGEGQIVSNIGEKSKFWVESLDQWYPEGPGDPTLALIKLPSTKIEVWSATRKIMPGTGAAMLTRLDDGWALSSTDRRW